MKYRLYGDKFSPFPGTFLASCHWMEEATADDFIAYCIDRGTVISAQNNGNVTIQYMGNTMILVTEKNDRENHGG